jgi:biopolymer transport protein ExbD
MEVLEFLNKGGYSKVKLVTLEGVPGAAPPPQDAPAAAPKP